MVYIRAHTQREKNIKNETFYQISPEKIPNHQSLVCMFLIVCMFFVFLVYNKKAFAQLSDIKDHGRGVPRDHSDTVRSGNHMNIMSGFFIMY